MTEAFKRVTFTWSTQDGECYECGRPAAFYKKHLTHEGEMQMQTSDKLCAVCAANAACDGESIARIRKEAEVVELWIVFHFDDYGGWKVDYVNESELAARKAKIELETADDTNVYWVGKARTHENI